MGTCYKSQDSVVSVLRRGRQFAEQVSRWHPTISEEEAFLLWIERKRSAGQISASSALQYMTYWRMGRPDGSLSSFPPRETGGFQPSPRKSEDSGVTGAGAQVISSPQDMLTAALSLQWSTAGRFVDVERLLIGHVFPRPGETLITLVGGKTDRQGKGQGVVVPSDGNLFGPAKRWIEGRMRSATPDRRVFSTISRVAYNRFLMKSLNVTAHDIRHAALTHVARRLGEGAAQSMARHAEASTTRLYIPPETWQASAETRAGGASLQ
eukprot:TRINITY_DN6941_c0_g3_i1.p3 TRINITY_DN6941_c0_g3~~TRINITY_DN6941_c0_g3_i1.p3  ORF type:complete len:266 (-),score=11.24 TRINITY_DN6941_c0_g3_i1:1684-2481(-)